MSVKWPGAPNLDGYFKLNVEISGDGITGLNIDPGTAPGVTPGQCYSPWCDPPTPTTYKPLNPCDTLLRGIIDVTSARWHQQNLDSVRAAFVHGYINDCMKANETFTVQYDTREHHYTLYYYDQAGNLVQTVPPLGVGVLSESDIQSGATHPGHTYKTNYKYNSLNQLREQTTPDGGTTRFWYDELGRLVISQNAEQALHDDYSYMRYGPLGRVFETGQVNNSATWPTTGTSNSFVTTVAAESFITSGQREQITRTYYDREMAVPMYAGLQAEFGPNGQQNLRNRIASTTYQELDNPILYDHAIHYSYDPHGNVDILITEIPELAALGHNIKKITYDYDLVSGNVKKLNYQEGRDDQFFHRYEYDADNRIVETETSPDGVIWDEDAEYFYYKHGPLSRTEIGEHKVQGTDYVYTAQGWLKGVNSNSLTAARDAGKDGADAALTHHYNTATPGMHQFIGQDAVGFTLGYFNNDYQSIHDFGTDGFEADINPVITQMDVDAPGLFNGNIRTMSTANRHIISNNQWAFGYQYDQLNRLVHAQPLWEVDQVNNSLMGALYPDNFKTDYTYDANGNILTLLRNAYNIQSAGNEMDNMAYTYVNNTNRLDFVNDISTANDGQFNDIRGGQTTGNYTYDAIGNLTGDVQEEIVEIEWTVSGKIDRITRSTSSAYPDLKFGYDGLGNRYKKVAKAGSDEDTWTYTYYVRDAQGNIMATYSRDYPYQSAGQGTTNYEEELHLSEHVLYGSSRLGVKNHNRLLTKATFDCSNCFNTNGTFDPFAQNLYTLIQYPTSTSTFTRELDNKHYEMTNHLGNVLATITDRKLPQDNNSDQTIDLFDPVFSSAHSYYPFGMIRPNAQNLVSAEGYRFGFNGMEMVDEVKGFGNHVDFGARGYDVRIGKWFSPDKFALKYTSWSPYNFAVGNPNLVIDPDGNDIYIYYVSADKTWKGMFGHTALGQGYGENQIKYYRASGNFGWTYSKYIPCANGEPGCFREKTYVDEAGTMKLYMDNGDVIIRSKLAMSRKTEEGVRHMIDDWTSNPGSTDGLWCTCQVEEALALGMEKQYGKEKASMLAKQLIDYTFPENKSEKEMYEMGFDGYDKLYKQEGTTDQYVFQSVVFNEDGSKTTTTSIKTISLHGDKKSEISEISSETSTSQIGGLSSSSSEKREQTKQSFEQ